MGLNNIEHWYFKQELMVDGHFPCDFQSITWKVFRLSWPESCLSTNLSRFELLQNGLRKKQYHDQIINTTKSI